MLRCSTWLGDEVDDQSGVNVGGLTDFMIDLPAERVVFAAVTFFGWDANTHVLPPGALSAGPDGNRLRLAMDGPKLAAVVDSDEFVWTETADPAWVAEVYRAYGKQIVLEAPPSLDAAVARVRAPIEPPPAPPETAAMMPEAIAPDTNLARAVMTAIIQADPANVALAQGIKVTVAGDRVVLTGPVGSTQQKSSLGWIAEGVAGVGKVSNELEVK